MRNALRKSPRRRNDVSTLKGDMAEVTNDVATLKTELAEFKVEVNGALAEILNRLPAKGRAGSEIAPGAVGDPPGLRRSLV